MVKVAFWFDAPVEYSGGLNYIRNVLYALSLVNDGTILPYVFFSTDVTENVTKEFSVIAKVVKTKILKRGTLAWIAHKIFYKMFDSMVLVNILLQSHDITILSHLWFVYKGRSPFSIISWIPDFQYLYLPELFPSLNCSAETKRNKAIIAQSDIVIISSRDALNDFKRIAPPEHQSKGRVLQFVSQPHSITPPKKYELYKIEKKYKFQGPYFFLPNQFWVHKNHMVVLRALKLLKDMNINVLVLCTGAIKDFRIKNTNHINSIYKYVSENELHDNFRILGHVDYGDVLFMMRNSLAVINPSFFEGWSSSVEEAKSMGQQIILSRIDVHVEQNPQNGRYFNPQDEQALSKILESLWSIPDEISTVELRQKAKKSLEVRTLEFGKKYLDILNDIERRKKQKKLYAGNMYEC